MTELRDGGPVAIFQEIVSSLDEKAINAARRNKPTMWAYYGDMADWLRAYFSEAEEDDGSYAAFAAVLVERAEAECPSLSRAEAAVLWARSVYCRRILNAWWPGVERYRSSLQWLRDRVSAGVPA